MWRVVIDEIMSLYKPIIIFSLISIPQCDELWYKLYHWLWPQDLLCWNCQKSSYVVRYYHQSVICMASFTLISCAHSREKLSEGTLVNWLKIWRNLFHLAHPFNKLHTQGNASWNVGYDTVHCPHTLGHFKLEESESYRNLS